MRVLATGPALHRLLIACAMLLAARTSSACDDDVARGGEAGAHGDNTPAADDSGAPVRDAAIAALDAGGHEHRTTSPRAADDPECAAAADCPEPASEGACAERVCRNGRCGVDYAPEGTALPAQTRGDCRTAVCDGSGNATLAVDDADVASDDSECTADACGAGTVLHTPLVAGSPCAQDGGRFCDDGGACVECVLPSQCDSGVCQAGSCRPPLCGNATLDPDEADVDCGGSCAPCQPGRSCTQPADCAGMECSSGRCIANCSDGIRNNDETATDCGGSCEAACENGQACRVAGDCSSGFCHPETHRCATPSCSDAIENGTEILVDCGGPSCPACPAPCEWNDECNPHDFCYANLCVHALNGCSIETATDLRGMAEVTIDFDANGYSPSCALVTMYAQVTFRGDFAAHPLVGGEVKNGLKLPAASGPFVPATSGGTSQSFSMDTCSTFPFYCDAHALSGMAGTIFVVAP